MAPGCIAGACCLPRLAAVERLPVAPLLLPALERLVVEAPLLFAVADRLAVELALLLPVVERLVVEPPLLFPAAERLPVAVLFADDDRLVVLLPERPVEPFEPCPDLDCVAITK
jgi:hypothetical protein